MIIADYRVCLDACVLANYGVCDLLLRLAEQPRLYLPVFSQDILDEVRRTQVKRLNWPEELAESFQSELVRMFPEAMVAGYEDMIPVLKNDPKDRHVLAAAIQGRASLIVTFNLKDFPAEALKPWGVEVCHPQDYLTTLFSLKAETVVAKIYDIAGYMNQSPQQRLVKLAPSVPRFCREVNAQMGWSDIKPV